MWEDYYRPQTLQEALDILSQHPGKARVIAGGTDLLLDLKNASKQVEYLVDIREIEGMTKIEERDGRLFIGACVTHGQLAASPLIRKMAAALAEGAAMVGSVQVRNISTVGGNIVNANRPRIPLFPWWPWEPLRRWWMRTAQNGLQLWKICLQVREGRKSTVPKRS